MFCGCQCASRLSQTWSKSSCFSPGRTTVLAHRPLRREFRRTAALPAGVLGPVDFNELRRLASICFSVAIVFFGGAKPNWVMFSAQEPLADARGSVTGAAPGIFRQ